MTPRRSAFVADLRIESMEETIMKRTDRYGHESGSEARTVALILAAAVAAVGISLLCGV